jgi:hypothetical protein
MTRRDVFHALAGCAYVWGNALLAWVLPGDGWPLVALLAGGAGFTLAFMLRTEIYVP